MKGIDVSNHNGKINWSKVKSDGVELVYIKATEGTTYQDLWLENHYQGARSVGLFTGFYHFLVGTSQPESQAHNFYNQIKDKKNDLIPCLDIEVSGFDVGNYALRFLKKFKELKLGGENTIPATESLYNAYFPNYEYREYPLSEEDNAMYSDITVASLTYDATKQKLKYMNQLYNDGLISPEWYLDKDGNQKQADFVSGKAGVFGFYLSQNPPVLQTLLQNCPDAKVAVLDAGAGYPEGTKPAGRADWPFGMVSGISVDCEHPEAVLMYFEWLAQDENLFVMQNGIENVTYKVEDEIPVLIDDYTGEERLNYNSNKDMWCLVTEGKDYGSDEKNLAVQKKTYAPAGFEDLIQQSYDGYQKTKEYKYTDFLFDRAIDSLSQYAETLKSKWEVIQVDLINCKPEEFDAKYEAACKEYLDAGYQAVLDEKEQAYADMKK